MEVPPSHSVQYTLIFNAFNTTINAYTDLKLTLCSAFVNPTTTNDASHYIYIDNIPGVITHKEVTSCNVYFDAAQYVRNDITCIEEQKLAFASGSDYIPKCKSTDPDLYDGCQCDIGNSLTLGQCMCVDKLGNILSNKLAYVSDGESFEKVCVQDLQCNNTEITYNNSQSSASSLPNISPQPQSPTIQNISQLIQSWLFSLLALFFIIFLVFKICKSLNMNNKDSYSKVLNQECDEEQVLVN